MATCSVWAVGDAVVGAVETGRLGVVDPKRALGLTIVHHILLVAGQNAATPDGASLRLWGVRAVLA
jgi:hypothetical protein